MEKIKEMFEKLNLKAQILEEAMLVLPEKTNLMGNLDQLKEENDETKKLEKQIKASIKNYEDKQRKEYEDVTTGVHQTQLKMMYLLEYFNKLEQKLQKEERTLQPLHIPGTPKLLEREGAAQAFSEVNTPRMHVSEYAKSPFIKKRLKVQLQFSDFEAEITKDDFDKIPSYMRGRATLSELQDFLDNAIIRTFNNKYRTLYQARESLKPSEFNLQSMFKSQASYFEGQKFITVGDIARILEKNVEKRDDRFIQMLRHLQIIREARKNSTVCYIWIR